MKQTKLGSYSALTAFSAVALSGLLLGACASEQPPASSAAAPPAAAPQAVAPQAAPAPLTAPQAASTVAAPAPAGAVTVGPPVLLKDVGFITPESVLYDADADDYLVSNINGSPTAKDDNGFISLVAPDGTVKALKWIDGAKANITLNAPKGMAIVRGLLYVADIDFVRIFNANTGAPTGKIGIPKVTFLNDIAAGPDGSIYVTDSGLKVTAKGFEPSGTDAVYKIDAKGKAESLIHGASLNRPNGVFADDSGVWVVTFGSKELYRVANGEKTNTVELPAGSLDGLIRLPDGGVLASSWDSSTVYYGKDGKFTALITNAKSPADIGFDSKRSTVLVPLFTENAVLLQKVSLPVSPMPATVAAPAPVEAPKASSK